MRGVVAAAVVTSLIAALAVTSLEEVGAAPCTNEAFATIPRGGKGPIVCSNGGVKTVIVPAQTPLELSSMRVTLLRTRTTQTIASTFQHAKASGAFLVVTLRVTNHTVTPQRLNPYRQARLRIAGGEYSVSFAGQSADAGDEAWQKKIGSEKSRTADLVFELPRAALQETSARVVLQFTNFGEVLPGQTSEVGLIYLGAGSQVRTQPHATQITDGWRSPRRSLDLGGAYRRETSSATISAAGCRRLASATLCPAHSDSASMSPVVPTSGGAGEYRTIGSPEAKCAIT